MLSQAAHATPADSSSSLGSITVVEVGRIRPRSEAVVARMTLGKSPVRIELTRDGRIAWVTSRGGNELLALDTDNLVHQPERAVLATIPVGIAPIGVALVADDRIAVVANSNRFASSDEPQTLSVIDTAAALSNGPSVIGAVKVGAFPRELAVLPGGRSLVVTNFGSSSITAVSVAALELAVRDPGAGQAG